VGSLVIDNAYLKKESGTLGFSEGMISLDFDDGWVSTYNAGLPILNAAGLKSTQYIITGNLPAGTYDYVSTAQMLQMKADGHEIGAHSRTHPDLLTLADAALDSEISGSRSDLVAAGVTPVSFSYPFGNHNSVIEQKVRDAGFSMARSALISEGGMNYQNTNRYLIKTYSVENSTTIDSIKAIVDNAITTKGWAVLVFHQVNDSGSQYSISPTNLQQIVDYIKLKNVKVVTASQALSHLPI
jgi:peptidoglycan/xylan/chitin deacetylase (PgdA/CDA1 family)